MQLKKDEDDQIIQALCAGLQQERVDRYKKAADEGGVSVLELYIWNCNLSLSFYHSLHFAEITCRNSIHNALLHKNGEEWYNHRGFRNILKDSRFLKELDDAIYDEKQQHGESVTGHHIVSALTFGFWEHLTKKPFRRALWPAIKRNFKNSPQHAQPNDLNELIQKVRRWRNRIAHHKAIFDKKPTGKHDDIIRLIAWSDKDLAGWVRKQSQVPTIINERPKAE